MRRYVLFLSTFAVVFALLLAQDPRWAPDMPTIQKLQSTIQPNAYPKWGYVGKVPDLSRYARYYSGYKKEGHKLVEGEFVLQEFPREKGAGIYVVASPKAFPMISDGACAVIHVLYDADTSKMLSLSCNGRA